MLWAAYGLLSGSWPVVGSNLVCLALAAAILALKMRYGVPEKEKAAGVSPRGPVVGASAAD